MKLLVTGGTGFIGGHVVEHARAAGHEVTVVARSGAGPGVIAADLVSPTFLDALAGVSADALIHLAALSDIGPCREQPELAKRLNTDVPGELARACAARGTRMVHVSTDQVFDGSEEIWDEDDEPVPIHEYGRTKLAGEHAVEAALEDAAIVRPALVTGRAPAGRRSSTSWLIEQLERGESPVMFTDEWRSPVGVRHLARALVELAARAETGTFHVGGPARLTRYELACQEAERAGLSPKLVREGTRADAGLAEERPADLSLDSSQIMATLGWVPMTFDD